MLSNAAVLLLDRLEREERRLLAWGCVDGSFDSSEIFEHAEAIASQHPEFEAEALLEELVEANWLFSLPYDDGRYRTRSAETIRLLARLRQIRAFPSTPPERLEALWRTGPSLVADYRLLVQPRRFPYRDSRATEVESSLTADKAITSLQRSVFRALLHVGSPTERTMSGFQVRATKRILASGSNSATIVCAGTGTGKTMAFYLPAFMRIAPLLDQHPWTKALAIYPRNELLKDQLRDALDNARRVSQTLIQSGKRPLVLGAFYGDVKRNPRSVTGKYGWPEVRHNGAVAHECPFVRCPSCSLLMVWLLADINNGLERLVCPGQGCGLEYGPDVLRLTRKSMLASPPDILFTSTEMLNQRLASTEFSRLLGIGVAASRRPVLMLLDEAHTYEGIHGAHVALLLRRWRHRSQSAAHVVGLSATLEDAARFFGDLVGIPASSVSEVAPTEAELGSEGADYQVAVRGDAMSGTSLLSTTIQTSMLMRRVLATGQVANVLSGNKVFAFADNLDVVNRLFDNLRDAEGRWPNNRFRLGARVLAGFRSAQRSNAAARYRDGQSWDIAERIGHSLDLPPSPASSLEIHRTMALDPGVEARADVVIATASLEVGYDDPRVGVVIQHKAPRSDASFVQRKGRAGRMRVVRPDGTSASMRPWTVVVLSNFGRDRVAYQDYERIFSPTLPPRFLPLKNRALLRMQATYALFDWLSSELQAKGLASEPWTDLATWRDQDEPRRRSYVEALRALIEQPDVQRGFARHLRGALGIPNDEVQAVLWESPRSVVLEAAPTLLRRLETSWARAADDTKEPDHPYGPPLPEFVQKTLFGELLAPEVEVQLPPERHGDEPTFEGMPLFHCIREFAPGRVSRRFGLRGNISHWIDPGTDAGVPIAAFTDREVVGRFTYRGDDGLHEVNVYRPLTFRVTSPPSTVAPTSNARTEWRSQLVASPNGHSLDVPTGVPFSGIVETVRFHTHHLGAPIEIRRFAIGARVDLLLSGGVREPERVVGFTDESGEPAALGTALDVDALEVEFRYPSDLRNRVAGNEVLVRALRPIRFRDVLRADSRLDGRANRFQRDMLSEAVIGALVLAAAHTGDDLEVELSRLTRDQVFSVLARMALWAVEEPTDGSDTPDTEPGTDTGTDSAPPNASTTPMPKRIRELGEILDQDVFSLLQELASVLCADIGPDWDAWLHESFKATLGASLHDAIIALCPAIDENALVVDLDADLRNVDGDADRVWVTESSVGGSGALEAFYDAYGRDPRNFFRIWDAELGVGDLEQVSTSLNDLLSQVAGPTQVEELANRFDDVRRATNHQSLLRATQRLRTAIARGGYVADAAFMAAVHARLLRPGTSAVFDEYLFDVVDSWTELERRLEIAIDLPLFALTRAENPGLEQALGLTPPSDNPHEVAAWRYSSLLGVLWRRPDSIRRESLRVAGAFSDSPHCDRMLVAIALDANTPRIDVTVPQWFAELENALVGSGSALVHAPSTEADRLADALLKIATTAVDTGGIRVFGRAGPVRRTGTSFEVSIELPEAFQ